MSKDTAFGKGELSSENVWMFNISSSYKGFTNLADPLNSLFETDIAEGDSPSVTLKLKNSRNIILNGK